MILRYAIAHLKTHNSQKGLRWFAADVIYAFHNGEKIGPRMLARIARHTGLKPEDL